MKTNTVIITGGCGFIGHHFVEHFLKKGDRWKIIIFDRLTYASSGLDRVRDIQAFDSNRVHFLGVDLTRPIQDGVLKECRDARFILHLAAESHVDRSIEDAAPFVMSNVLGTVHLLDFARKLDNLESFLYFGTDEVFGPADEETSSMAISRDYQALYSQYHEWDRYNSSNPYAASKAGGEEMCLAYYNTHKVPVVITHTMNCFGERQHPEKYIPLIIKAGLTGEKVSIHAYPGLKKAGSRFYIHCRNVAKVCEQVIRHAPHGEKFNIVGEKEVDNYELLMMISSIMGTEIKFEFVDFHASRPGHDLRYALSMEKTNKTFFLDRGDFLMPFHVSLEKTVKWYMDNQHWLFTTT